MTLVKICGITNLEDALAAVDAGADTLGFNFYRPSPRYIEPEEARRIIEQLPERIFTVGVFVNHTLEYVETILGLTGIRILQLHGDESPEYCEALKLRRRYVMKAFNASEHFNIQRLAEYNVPEIIIDSAGGNMRGGTGQIGDWRKAREIREAFPIMFLAGGLSDENVADAIAAVEPFGVDACSLLELAPGKKDHARVRAFVRAVREASPHVPHGLLDAEDWIS